MKASLWREYEVDQDKIEQLRVKVYDYARSHPDEIDINDVKNRIISPEDIINNNVDANNNKITDWMLKRLLISSHKDVSAALDKFVDFFRFRNKYQLAQLTQENVLPAEFFHINPFDADGFDKERNRNFVIRLKYYKKLPQFEVIIKRGIMYFAEQMDLQYEQGVCDGVCLILDCQDFTLSSLDMDMLQFLIKQVPLSYMGLVRCVIIYEIHYLLGYLFKVVQTWMPASTAVDKNGNKRKLFFSIGKKEIKNFVDEDQLPEYLEGTRKVIKEAPPNALPFEQMARHVQGIDGKNVQKIKEYLVELTQT